MTNGHDDPAGELGANIGELVRRELRTMARELRTKGKQGGTGMVLVGIAGVSALYAGGFALYGLASLLKKVLPEWLASWCTAGLLSLAAGVAAAVGLQRVRAALPLVPEELSADATEAARAVRGNEQ